MGGSVPGRMGDRAGRTRLGAGGGRWWKGGQRLRWDRQIWALGGHLRARTALGTGRAGPGWGRCMRGRAWEPLRVRSRFLGRRWGQEGWWVFPLVSKKLPPVYANG